MNLFAMIDESGGAMQAERMRAEVVAANMANAETTRTQDGTPYRRQHVIFAAGPQEPGFGAAAVSDFAGAFAAAMPPGGLSGRLSGSSVVSGVHIAGVIQDKAAPLKRFDPGHPDADAEGYVGYPDINPLTEMVDLMGATRAYGLNASAVQAEKAMIATALEIAK